MMKKTLSALALSLAMMSCGWNTANNNCPLDRSSGEVKNVIFMIGDGMGLAQAAQLMVERGYDSTAFDRAHNIALIKTYSSNNRVTDSAAAGTALATGHKTNNKMLGLTPQLDTCYSLAVRAKRQGKAAGVVVTCALQHATPAAFYAHVEERYDNNNITRQLANSSLDVAIGGGAKYFDLESGDGTYLDVAKGNGFNIVTSFDDIANVGEGRLLAILEKGHIKSIAEGRGDYLSRSTQVALDRLSQNKEGFFLMVEGSQIDWVCHNNNAEGTLQEVADFNDCVNLAMDFADNNPGTLVVVTADHETGGMSLVSNDADFTKSDSGVAYKYSTGGHSGVLVPVYSYGTCAGCISGVMENTALSNKIGELLGL